MSGAHHSLSERTTAPGRAIAASNVNEHEHTARRTSFSKICERVRLTVSRTSASFFALPSAMLHHTQTLPTNYAHQSGTAEHRRKRASRFAPYRSSLWLASSLPSAWMPSVGWRDPSCVRGREAPASSWPLRSLVRFRTRTMNCPRRECVSSFAPFGAVFGRAGNNGSFTPLTAIGRAEIRDHGERGVVNNVCVAEPVEGAVAVLDTPGLCRSTLATSFMAPSCCSSADAAAAAAARQLLLLLLSCCCWCCWCCTFATKYRVLHWSSPRRVAS